MHSVNKSDPVLHQGVLLRHSKLQVLSFTYFCIDALQVHFGSMAHVAAYPPSPPHFCALLDFCSQSQHVHIYTLIPLFSTGNPLLNESACPHCNTTAGECIYFAYEYRCRCIKGYAMLIDYSAEENWINNEPHIPTDESPHNCDDVDECG
jgi:hypothetical protein